MIKKQRVPAECWRFADIVDDQELGRLKLSIIYDEARGAFLGHISGVCVDYDARHNGKATALYKAVKQFATERKLYKLVAECKYSDPKETEKALKFFSDLGFVDYGRYFRLDLE